MKNAPSFGEFKDNYIQFNIVKNYQDAKKEAQSEIDKSLKLMEQSVNERGIYLDKDKDKFVEVMSQEVLTMFAKWLLSSMTALVTQRHTY